MKIRCKHCGEYFCPSDESVDLISEGFISPDSVNICDNRRGMIEYRQDDLIKL